MLEHLIEAMQFDIKPDVPGQWAPGAMVSLLPDGQWYVSAQIFLGNQHKRTIIAKGYGPTMENAVNECVAGYNAYCAQAGIV